MIIQVMMIAIISLFILKTFQFIYPLREKISCTTGMMATMIIGSMTGLIAGTILALNQS
ncbi:hypothetical protein [Halalkalibacter alkalisediminis]|uniref:Uncharacterized protein n=1 Tax=Halalkalibacter alkalisediminis TaxID=935616 RepID=A0ABV6NHT5_9BACI|nr:hypothetical protein [Halalkalibacter alkalisediminis]